MLKARIADWILSLVVDRERSASAVGDLMEEGSGSMLGFSMSVGRIFVSAFAHSFGMSWPRIARLTGLGLLPQFAGMIVMIGLIAAVSAVIGYVIGYLRLPANGTTLAPVMGLCMGFTLLTLIEFQVGKLIARRSPGQELAVCVALTATWSVLDGLIGMGNQRTCRPGHVHRLYLQLVDFRTPGVPRAICGRGVGAQTAHRGLNR
jgi:hypothetical protein